MLRSAQRAQGRSSIRVSELDQMYPMQESCSTVLCGTEKHDCRKKKCGICGKFVKLERHYCFIQPETKKRKRKRSVEGEESGGFFNTECREEEEEEDDEPVEETLTDLLFYNLKCRQENGTHEPNLCIVQNEAGEEWIFQGNTTQKDFCKWLFTDDHIGCTVMAHNFQGYDSYFVLQCLREQGVKYDVIMRGGKIWRFPC